MLLHFHHYPTKDNFLTSGYMRRYFYLLMAFLGPEFSRHLCNTLANVMKVSWTHLKCLEKLFFYSVKPFNKNLDISFFDNVKSQQSKYVMKNDLHNIYRRKPVFGEEQLFSKIEACSFFIIHLRTTASERVLV